MTKKSAICVDISTMGLEALKGLVFTLGNAKRVECPISMWDLTRKKYQLLVHYTDGLLSLCDFSELGELAEEYNLKAFGQDYEAFVQYYFNEAKYWQAK